MNVNLEVNELDIVKTLHESIITNESLFGLGRNFYDPTTNTLSVFAHSRDTEALLSIPQFWFASRTLCHEVGHYILSAYTRFGRVIRDITAIQNGLTFLIIKRMLKEHRKLWIPFDEYFDFDKKHATTVKLIINLHHINRLGTVLIKEWQTAQELFAYSWSGLFNLTTRNALSNLFPTESEDGFVNIFLSAKSIFNLGEERVQQIISKIDHYLQAKYSMTWNQISREKRRPIINDLMQNVAAIFGTEDKDAMEFLTASEGFTLSAPAYSQYRTTFQYSKETMDSFRNHVDHQFEQGEEQHRQALRVFRQCFGENPFESMKNVLLWVAISSSVFAPRILPEEVLDGPEGFPQVERFNGFIQELPTFTKGKIVEIFNHEFFDSTLLNIQSLTGSVTLQDLHRYKSHEILGTDEWNFRLITQMQLRRRERRFLRQILELNKCLDLEKISVFPLKIHWPFRVLLRFAFIFKGLLLRISVLRNAFGFMAQLNIKSYRHSKAFISVYKDLLSLPYIMVRKFAESALVDIPLMTTINAESFNIYFDKQLLMNSSRMALFRHLEGHLRDLCIHLGKGSKTHFFFCPFSVYESRTDTICEKIPNCWLFKLLARIGGETVTLICSRDGAAHFSTPLSTNERQIIDLKLVLKDNCNFNGEEIQDTPKPEKSLSEYYSEYFGSGEESLLRFKERHYDGTLLRLIVCRGGLKIYRAMSYMLLFPVILIKGLVTIAFLPAFVFKNVYDIINKYNKWMITRALRKTSDFKLSVIKNISNLLSRGVYGRRAP